MRYSYVDPAPPSPVPAVAETPGPSAFVICRADGNTGDIGPDDPRVTATARRLYATVEATPGRMARLTYALAAGSAGEALETVFLRVYDRTGSPIAYLGWLNGKPRPACIMDGRIRHVGIMEFTAWVEGRAYVPPAPRPPVQRGACPDCGKSTRRKLDGTLYKHPCERSSGNAANQT